MNKTKAPVRTWNVMFDIAFTVENCPEEDGANINPSEIREAILKRLAALTDAELREVIGFCDSYANDYHMPTGWLLKR